MTRLNNAYMKVAEVFADLSYAKRRKVGAVLVRDKSILAEGYNGTPPGWDNTCEDENNVTKPEVTHAEQNCLDKITRSNMSSQGATLYVTTAPCIECAKRILGAGINSVYYRDVYRSTDGLEFLASAGIPTEQI